MLSHKHANKVKGVKRLRFKTKEQRQASSKRGYGAPWRRLRAEVMTDIAIEQGWPYPCCEYCLNDGEHVHATDLDHKVSKRRGGTDDRDNLQALCHSCHSKKTAKEDEGFGNRRKNND